MNQKSWWKKRGAGVTRAASRQEKRVSHRAFDLLYSTTPLEAAMGDLGSLIAILLQSRVTYILKDFVVVWLTLWIRAECPTKPWLAFGESSTLGLLWKESVCTETALQLD